MISPPTSLVSSSAVSKISSSLYDYDYGRKIIGYYSTITFDVKLDGLDKVKECASVLTEKLSFKLFI